jgi:Polyketide cyclase / dehydrase and lipid transport
VFTLDDKHAEESLLIEAPPEVLYDLVADLTRMGEISSVCTGGFYDDDAVRGAGAWFTGRNQTPQLRWETRCHVVTADRPSEVAWEMCGGRALPPENEAQPAAPHGAEEPVSRWRYTFRAVEGGTEVVESWELLRVRDHTRDLDEQAQAQMVEGMHQQLRDTLAKLAEVVTSTDAPA